MDRLNAMRAFVRVVELRTFTAVAEELRVTQSTVSKWLAALEEEAGVQLLARTTRTKRVTEAGSAFYERSKEILASYDGLMAELHSDGEAQLRGRLRVSVPVVFGRMFAVEAVSAFLRRHPDIELDLVFSDRYVALVEEGFDVALRVGTPVDSSLRARVIASTPRRLVAAPDYLAEHGRPGSPTDLRQHECLIHSGINTGAVWVFSNGTDTVRTRVRGRFAANNSAALCEMAVGGLGVALLASWLVDDAIADRGLVELLPDYELPPAPIQALMPPGRHIHPRVRAFVDSVAAALGRRLAGKRFSP